MRKENNVIGRMMLGLALLCATSATALADPPTEDILYPAITSPYGAQSAGGKFFVQLDLGANQSQLYGRNGFHQSDITNDQVLGFQKSSNGIAPFAGLTLGYQFNSLFSLGLRLDYDAHFVSNDGTARMMCTEYDATTSEPIGQHEIDVRDTYEVGAKYMGITILPAIHFGDFYAYAGPSYMTPLSRDLRQTFAIPEDDADCQFFYGTSDATHTVVGRVTGSDNMLERLSLKLGLGYGQPIAPNVKLMFQAGYDLGASDLLGADDTIEMYSATGSGVASQPVTIHHNLRLSSIQGSLGLRCDF